MNTETKNNQDAGKVAPGRLFKASPKKAAKGILKFLITPPEIITSDIRRSLKVAKEAKKLLSEKDSRELGPAETFDQMIKRMGVTEDQIKARIKLSLFQSRLYAFFMCFILLWVAHLATFQASLMGGCAFLIASLLWFKWSLRLWRFRIRDLASVTDFLKSDWYLEWLK